MTNRESLYHQQAQAMKARLCELQRKGVNPSVPKFISNSSLGGIRIWAQCYAQFTNIDKARKALTNPSIKPDFWYARLETPNLNEFNEHIGKPEKQYVVFHEAGGNELKPGTGLPKDVRPIPFGLANINRGDKILLVEGFNKVQSAWTGFGIKALTSGGVDSADVVDWSIPAGMDLEVVGWADNDQSKVGEVYLQNVSAYLPMKYEIDRSTFDFDFDLVDYYKVLREKNPDTKQFSPADIWDLPQIEFVCAPPSEDTWKRLENLPEIFLQTFRPVDDPDLNQLPDIMKEMVEQVASDCKCSPALVVPSVISIVSFFLALHIKTKRNKGAFVVLLCWFLTLAKSGERKSTIDKIVSEAAIKINRMFAREHQLEMENYSAEMEEWNILKKSFYDSKRRGKKSNGAKVENAQANGNALSVDLLDPIAEDVVLPEKPKRPHNRAFMLSADTTIESLQLSLLKDSPIGMINSSEAGTLLSGYSMSPENATKTFAVLAEAYYGNIVGRGRAKDNEVPLPDKFGAVGLNLMTQPTVFLGWIENMGAQNVAKGIGFLARLFLSNPKSTMGTRFEQDEDFEEVRAPIYDKWAKLIYRLALTPYEIDSLGNLNVNTVITPSRPNGITKMYIDYLNQIEEQLASFGFLEEDSETASKIAEQSLRLAAVFAGTDYLTSILDSAPPVFADNPLADAVSQMNEIGHLPFEKSDFANIEISRKNMQAGIYFANYYLQQSVALNGLNPKCKDIQAALRLLIVMLDRYPSQNQDGRLYYADLLKPTKGKLYFKGITDKRWVYETLVFDILRGYARIGATSTGGKAVLADGNTGWFVINPYVLSAGVEHFKELEMSLFGVAKKSQITAIETPPQEVKIPVYE